jgi:hypothetical protein
MKRVSVGTFCVLSALGSLGGCAGVETATEIDAMARYQELAGTEWRQVSPRIIPSRRCGKDLQQIAIGGVLCCPTPIGPAIDIFRRLWSGPVCVGKLLGYSL